MNEAGQKIDAHGVVIPNENFVAENAGVVRHKTLEDYNRHDQFYASRSAIQPPPFQRIDFELKPMYYTLVGQHSFDGLLYEHPTDHLERFEDLVTSIELIGVSEDSLFCKMFSYSLLEMQLTSSSNGD